MTEKLGTRYSDGSYAEVNQHWHSVDSPYKFGLVNRAIERNNLRFATCADVGCGAGLVTELAAQHYPNSRFDGFEPAPDASTFIDDRANVDNLKFFKRDFFGTSNVYDLALCLDVFEHVEDYYSFLRKLREKADVFIFNIPLDLCVIKAATNGIGKVREEAGHLHYFNDFTALETLKDCGYTVEDAQFSAGFIGTPTSNLRQRLIYPVRLVSLLFGKKIASRLFGGFSLVVVARSKN